MLYYTVVYYTRRNVFSKSYLLKSDAIKFFEKVILRKTVDFACLDLNSDYKVLRFKTYRKLHGKV